MGEEGWTVTVSDGRETVTVAAGSYYAPIWLDARQTADLLKGLRGRKWQRDWARKRKARKRNRGRR